MRKNKRNLLVAIAAMGLVAAGTGAVSTFAWYTASNGSAGVGTVSAGTITTTDPSITLDALTFDFTLSVNGTTTAAVYLGAADATPATKAIYKVWNPKQTELIPYNIGDSGSGAAVYSSYFQEVGIAVSAIKKGGVDIKSTAASLNPYAGTYSFKLTCSADGVLSATAPTNSKTLGDMYNGGLQELAFTVIVPSSGTTLTGTYNTDDAYWVAVKGNDENKTHSETTALGVTYTSFSAA